MALAPTTVSSRRHDPPEREREAAARKIPTVTLVLDNIGDAHLHVLGLGLGLRIAQRSSDRMKKGTFDRLSFPSLHETDVIDGHRTSLVPCRSGRHPSHIAHAAKKIDVSVLCDGRCIPR